MRSYDSPYVSDWFVISLRWFGMLGLAVSLARADQLFLTPSLMLIGLAAWNLVLTFIAGVNRRLNFHREISLGIDLVLCGAFFWLQNGLAGPASWAGLIPILTASIYFEFWGGLLSGLVVGLLMPVYSLSHGAGGEALILTAYGAAASLGVGLLMGGLGKATTLSLRRLRLKNQDTVQRQRKFEDDRLHAIYDLTSTLVATLNYQSVLESVLDMSASVLGPDSGRGAENRMVSLVLLFQGEQLTVASARRLTSAEMRQSLPCQSGVLVRVLDDGEPVLIEKVADDPELSQFLTLKACRQVYCFPLRSGFNIYGLLLFGHPAEGYFNRERIDTLDILSRQAVIAIQNARLYQNLADERDRMVEIHEEARKKLARDLHDGPTQSVSAIAMRVNLAQRLLEKDASRASDELTKIEDLARRTTKEIRHMLFTLRPLVLESQGLVAALQANAEKMKETFGQSVTLDIDGKLLDEIEMGKQGVIFYLVEEALNNARKHAQAPNIWVRLKPVEKEIALLEIEDDGVGFNVAEINRAYDERGSLGMVNLRERTELINGFLNLLSTPGKGTRVQIYIPLSDAAAERMHRAIGKR